MQTSEVNNRRKITGGLIAIGAVVAFVGFGYWTLIKPQRQFLVGVQVQPQVTPAAASVDRPCATEMPVNGSVKVERSSVMNRTDVEFSGIGFRNSFDAPAIATLTDESGQAIVSVLAHPGQFGSVSAPVGRYGLKIHWGRIWCDPGFSDAHAISVNGGLDNLRGVTTQIDIRQDASVTGGVAVTIDRARPAAPKSTEAPSIAVVPEELPQQKPRVAGVLTLDADSRGQYRVDGSINGRATRFLLDTGATTTSISRFAANEAGIYQCEAAGQRTTANGLIGVCRVRVQVLRIGDFRIESVDVDVLDNLGGDALLGMNVLKHFSLHHANGRLQISAN